MNGLNALLATINTPSSAPLIAATRLRKGSTNSVRGAAKLLADALVTARRAGAGGLVIVRANSALCRHRHKSDYAEVLAMPALVADPLVRAMNGRMESA